MQTYFTGKFLSAAALSAEQAPIEPLHALPPRSLSDHVLASLPASLLDGAAPSAEISAEAPANEQQQTFGLPSSLGSLFDVADSVRDSVSYSALRELGTSLQDASGQLQSNIPTTGLSSFGASLKDAQSGLQSIPAVFFARGSVDTSGFNPEWVSHRSLTRQALVMPADAIGAAAQGTPAVEIGPTATTSNLVARAEQAGLSPLETEKLESILQDSTSFEADAQLVEELLTSDNPARALRTFNDLDVYRSQNGDRITPDIVRVLSLGVGQARTGASQGREGLLGNETAINAAEALVAMPEPDYAVIRDALDRAGPNGAPAAAFGANAQTEQALILKAVAARRDTLKDTTAYFSSDGQASPASQEIAQFADQIRGRGLAWLIENTTAMDLDGDSSNEALQQKWNDSCVQATLQIARAEGDPVYALWLHQTDVLHNTATTGTIADEQRTMLIDAGGLPRVRGMSGSGTTADPWTASMNSAVSPTTGRAYQERAVGNDTASRTNAVNHIELLVKTGTDVPIGVRWNAGGGHALLVTDVRGSGTSREFLVTDPWNGRTDWVSGDAIVNGNTNFLAGTGRLSNYWW